MYVYNTDFNALNYYKITKISSYIFYLSHLVMSTNYLNKLCLTSNCVLSTYTKQIDFEVKTDNNFTKFVNKLQINDEFPGTSVVGRILSDTLIC